MPKSNTSTDININANATTSVAHPNTSKQTMPVDNGACATACADSTEQNAYTLFEQIHHSATTTAEQSISCAKKVDAINQSIIKLMQDTPQTDGLNSNIKHLASIVNFTTDICIDDCHSSLEDIKQLQNNQLFAGLPSTLQDKVQLLCITGQDVSSLAVNYIEQLVAINATITSLAMTDEPATDVIQTLAETSSELFQLFNESQSSTFTDMVSNTVNLGQDIIDSLADDSTTAEAPTTSDNQQAVIGKVAGGA